MCGICGILIGENSAPVDQQTLLGMRDVMTHRGPDDAGIFLSGHIGLGARRLSIIDLSQQGHMPMHSTDERYVIIYNGEVYNYRELRSGLEKKGWQFRSKTDTEVILALYAESGPEMLPLLNGMFAIAIWDQKERTLFLARDRMGVKPLYYARHEGNFYFASEQKGLFAAGLPCAFDENTWHELLLFRYAAGERTPYKNIKRLLPGHYMLIAAGNISINRWWGLNEAITRTPGTFDELFTESIQQRLISDVPVGLLLSGGLDSSTMTSVTSSQAGDGVNSFTVRFQEDDYDEGRLARQVAQQCGTKHHEQYVFPDLLPSLLQDATWLLDEPLVHGNDPHLLFISRFAKPLVTVLLSGEGADEVFGGYVRYRPFLYPALLKASRPALHLLGSILPFNGRVNKTTEIFRMDNAIHNILFSSADVFPSILTHPPNWEETLAYRVGIAQSAQEYYPDEPVRQVMHYDQHTYLQSILDRNDRMTMGASIECREPFLDFRLVKWAARLPTKNHFGVWVGKRVIREAMKGHLPPNILNHRKWGFGVPWSSYLRNVPALRSLVQSLPNDEVIRSVPLSLTQLKEATTRFLAGDDALLALIRILSFTALWHAVCVRNQRNYLEEISS